MKHLMIVLIAIGAERFLGDVLGQFRRFRQLDWYHALAASVEARIGSIEALKGPAGAALLIAIPVLAGWFVYLFVAGIHTIFGVLFAIVVLWYCIGPRDLDTDVREVLIAVRGGNDAEANRLTQNLSGAASPVTTETRGRQASEAVLVEANNRLYGVLFWFLVLGPLGALLFRFSAELRRYATKSGSGLAAGAALIHDALSWIPARLTACAYALGGNLPGALRSWRVAETLGLDQTQGVLRDSGIGALQVEGEGPETWQAKEIDRVTAALDLAFRALVILLGFVLLLYILLWVA